VAFFGTDAQSWINLQTRYDAELARESMRPEFDSSGPKTVFFGRCPT